MKDFATEINSYLLLEDDFLFFKKQIYRLAGIHLSDKKRDLVFSRLRSHLYRSGIPSFAAYRELFENGLVSADDQQTFINLLTTNKTEFFREPRHFDFIAELANNEWRKKKKPISVWSCASSTGEEPYTLAMLLDRYLTRVEPSVDFNILATDIDTAVLKQARNGVYPIEKLQEIPDVYHQDSLQVGRAGVEGWFKMADHLHQKIEFRHHNLTSNEEVGDQAFDLIACRNVLIYFSPETVRQLMLKLHRVLKPDGYLIIGHAESIQKSRDLFQPIQPAVFRKII